MTGKIIRILAVLSTAFVFLFILFYIPTSDPIESEMPSAPSVSSIRVAVSVRPKKSKTPSQPSTESIEPEILPVPIAEPEETPTSIGSYLDAESDTEELVLPVIDLQKVYSRIIYPAALKRKNIEASFTVRVFVNKDGTIKLSFPEDINSAFVKSIEKAFNGIKAIPATLNGKNADVTFTIPFIFELK